MKTPLFATLFLGFGSGWIASCNDDSATACTPRETRICAGVGRCRGVEVCEPDGSGYGACDCSSAPREDAMEDPPTETPARVYVGLACAADADCGAGLTCYTPDSNNFLGGGPSHGYCSTSCQADADCTSVDRQSQCVVSQEGAAGLCLRTCLSLDPRSTTENKCLGRIDLVCESEAYLGLTTLSGLRQDGWCYPQCGSDDDCPGRACDLARGLCVDTPTPGRPIGAPCATAEDCAGRSCLQLPNGESFCSAPCVFGQPIGCGYGVTASARGAACVGPRMRGFLTSEGLGDVGICAELCAEDAECEQAEARGWTCSPNASTAARFRRPGVCNAPAPLDGGVDGGALDSNDASVAPPPTVTDAG